MRTPKTILAAALLCATATPVLAQEMGGAPGPGSSRGLQPTYHHRGYYQPYDSNGFWPGEVAGDVVGGAIGAAGAIATAPFRPWGQSYAARGPDASYCAQRYRSFDPASGSYLGHDGRRHPCP